MAKRNGGLGRGLDAIFFDNSRIEEEKSAKNGVCEVKISLVDPKSDQPRKYFDKEALEELASSIKDQGLLQPILVREYGDGRYQIIAGERRFRACKLAGITDIPAIVLDKTDKEVAEIALIENIQREDLNPIEEANAYRALISEYDLTQEELAQKIGKSRPAIANSMRLLDLPLEITTMVAAKELSAGHARTLLGLKEPDSMLFLAQKAAETDMSVRQLEEEVKRYNRLLNKPEVEEDEDEEPFVDYLREMELKIQRQLGRKAKIVDKGRKKTLTLFYEDNEDLDDLLKAICGSDFLDEV